MTTYVYVRPFQRNASSCAWRKTRYTSISEWRRATGAVQHLVQKGPIGLYCYRTRKGSLLDALRMHEDDARGMRIVERMATRYAQFDFDKTLSKEERKRAQLEVLKRALTRLRRLGEQR